MSIVGLFWRRRVAIVAAASAAGTPLAHWLTSEWLQGFAYRVELTAVPFVLSAAVTAVLFLTVVGVQAARAGQISPVETLRSE